MYGECGEVVVEARQNVNCTSPTIYHWDTLYRGVEID